MPDKNNKFGSKQTLTDDLTCYKNEIRRINDKINLIEFLCQNDPDKNEDTLNANSITLEKLKKEKRELEKGLEILEEIQTNTTNPITRDLLAKHLEDWTKKFKTNSSDSFQ